MPGLELSEGVTTASREPQWNAERRARPLARPAPEARTSGNIRPCGAVNTLRFSAFRFLRSVA
jgi:hypothetical protein